MDFAISEGRRESRITNPSESVSQERSASQSVSQSVGYSVNSNWRRFISDNIEGRRQATGGKERFVFQPRCASSLKPASRVLADGVSEQQPFISYLRMFGWLSLFMSCTSLSMLVRFERCLFILSTITFPVDLWVT